MSNDTHDGSGSDQAPEPVDLGFEISWTPNGRSGAGTIVLELPDGPYTESLKIVSSKARADLVDQVRGRVSEVQIPHLAAQLEQIASAEAEEQASAPAGSDSLRDRLAAHILAKDDVELFHDMEKEENAFVTISKPDGALTYGLGSGFVWKWIAGICFKELHEAAPETAIKEVINTLEAHACFEGLGIAIGLRSAWVGEGIAIDLANTNGEIALVNAAGWTVVESRSVAVRFPRRDAALPLPTPAMGGSVSDLRPLVNLQSNEHWTLLLCTLVAHLYPDGPYPVLVITGEQGSAKSSLCRYFQRLVDPNKGQLRRPPANEVDLMVAGALVHLLAYDNLSGVSASLADSICTVATGGGMSRRKLYTDSEEVIIHIQRPVLINGIDDFDQRSDLLDRAVVLELEPISAAERRDETELERMFDDVAPGMFGAVLTALSAGLRRIQDVQLTELPRMADFARRATASEAALGFESGAFMRAYESNRLAAQGMSLGQSPFALAISAFAHKVRAWRGPMEELRRVVMTYAESVPGRNSNWPATASAAGKQLRRFITPLRAHGVDVVVGGRETGKARTRLVDIRLLEDTLPPAADMSDMSDRRIGDSLSKASKQKRDADGPESLFAIQENEENCRSSRSTCPTASPSGGEQDIAAEIPDMSDRSTKVSRPTKSPVENLSEGGLGTSDMSDRRFGETSSSASVLEEPDGGYQEEVVPQWLWGGPEHEAQEPAAPTNAGISRSTCPTCPPVDDAQDSHAAGSSELPYSELVDLFRDHPGVQA